MGNRAVGGFAVRDEPGVFDPPGGGPAVTVGSLEGKMHGFVSHPTGMMHSIPKKGGR